MYSTIFNGLPIHLTILSKATIYAGCHVSNRFIFDTRQQAIENESGIIEDGICPGILEKHMRHVWSKKERD